MRLRLPEAMRLGSGYLRRIGATSRNLVVRRKTKPRDETGRWQASDFVVAGLGLALGVGCAVFPWYIFFNQEKFGVRAVRFEGNADQLRSAGMRITEPRLDMEMDVGMVLPEQLDLFATGTVTQEQDEQDEQPPSPPLPVVQAFPGPPVDYRMIHATPGRAMIADDTGMWVVQRGSLLPDNSAVASIEQRDGGWVLVTTAKKVIQLSPD
jgi:hypothetical protein